MKKLSLMVTGILFSVAALAQTTTTPTTPAEKAQMKDLRQDVRAYDNQKADAKAAINKGDLATAKTDLANAKADKADIKADASTLKSEGVKHPVKVADKQVKAIDVKEAKTS